MKTHILPHLALLLLLAAPGDAANARFPPEQVPAFNIPRMSTPPVLDGHIDALEWNEATRITGLAHVYSTAFYGRPHAFYLAWDAEHLYIAGRAHILPGHALLKSRRETYTTDVARDDAFEFGIDLLGRNKQPGETESFFKFVLNSLGCGEYIKTYPSIGQYLYNWRPTFGIANGFHQTGDGAFWEIEIAADLEDLQLPAPNRAGDTLKLLLATDLKNPGWQWACVPSSTGYIDPAGYPSAVLTERAPYVQIEKLEGLHDEKLALFARILNPAAVPVTIRASAHIDQFGSREGIAFTNRVLSEEAVLTLPPGGDGRFDIEKEFPGLEDDLDPQPGGALPAAFELSVTVDGASAAPPVYRYYLTFRKDDAKTYLQPTPENVPFRMESAYNPIRNTLWVSVDTLDAKIPPESIPRGIDFTVQRDGTNIQSGRIDTRIRDKFEDLVKLPALAPGAYSADIGLVDTNGTLLASRALTFVKRNESADFAPWWTNRIGNTERVLQPFEALRTVRDRRSRAAVSCTRRLYAFDSLGLPRGITANNGEVLSAPARIVVTINGRDQVIDTGKRLALTDRRDWRIRFEGAAEGAGLRFSSRGWIEQDGLVNLDLTFAPLADSVPVQALTVEWPLRDTADLHMAVIGEGGNYSARYIDQVPSGLGEVWNTLRDIGITGAGMTEGNFYRNVWVGNMDRGLLWCAHSDEGWRPSERLASHSLFRGDGAVVLRNHVIGTYPGEAPLLVAAPRTINLRYNASPFKRLTPGWRLNQRSAANGFTEKPSYKCNWDTGREYHSILSPPFPDTARWPAYYAHCREKADERARGGVYDPDVKLRPYLANQVALRGYMEKTLEPGLYDYFRGDWIADGGEVLSPSYIDYMVWLQNRQVVEGGCRHFHFDLSFSRALRGLTAGMGYRLPDGRVQPASGDENLREWYKRVAAMMQENGLYPAGVSGHATQSISLQALPFADAILDSEFPMKDAVTAYPMHRMIALSCPHNFGVNINHLRPMNPAWAALHDAGMGGGQGGLFETAEFRHWGIAAEDVVFIPYWRNTRVVPYAADGLLVSIWKRPGSAVLGVFNYGLDPANRGKTRAGEFTLDAAALGAPKDADGERIRIRALLNRDRAGVTPSFNPDTGAVTGFDIPYHEARFLALHWEDRPVRDRAWRELFTGAARTAALDWGLNRNDTHALSEKACRTLVNAGGNIRTQAWLRPNSALIRIENISSERLDAAFKLGLDELGVKVRTPWREFTQIYSIYGKAVEAGLFAGLSSPAVDILLGTRDRVLFDAPDACIRARLAPGESCAFSIDTY